MNRIVIYKSKSGFTRKYAEWIAQELECQALPLNKIKAKELSVYNQVIYGGAIMADLIKGLGKIKNLNLKKLIIFSCGMNMQTEEYRQRVANVNNIPLEGFYYFEGGYNPKMTGFMGRMIIKMISNNIKKKEIKTESDIHMLETSTGMDRTKRENIKELIEYAKER